MDDITYHSCCMQGQSCPPHSTRHTSPPPLDNKLTHCWWSITSHAQSVCYVFNTTTVSTRTCWRSGLLVSTALQVLTGQQQWS
jgi:hypothetical protein